MLNDKHQEILKKEKTPMTMQQKTGAAVGITGARAWYKKAAPVYFGLGGMMAGNKLLTALGSGLKNTDSAAAGPGFRGALGAIGREGMKFLSPTQNMKAIRESPIVGYGPQLATAGVVAPALYSMVPQDSSNLEKAEGGAAAGLMALGAAGLVNPRLIINTARAAKARANLMPNTGLIPDVYSEFTKGVGHEILLPKAGYAGLALVPSAALGMQKILRDSGKTTGNISDMTQQFKNMADSVNAKGEGGKTMLEAVRDATTTIAGNAADTSDTLNKGIATMTGDVTKGVNKITDNLGNASNSFAGMAEAGQDMAVPLSQIAGEVVKKDPITQKSLMENLSALAAQGGDAVKEFRQWFGNDGAPSPTMTKLRLLAGALPKYAPHAAAGGAGALGLYALYRMMEQNDKKKKRQQPSPVLA